jgi:hypothetical protein
MDTTYGCCTTGAAVVDELVHAVGVVGEVGRHGGLGQGRVEGEVDEVLEVVGDAGGISLGHARSRRSSRNSGAEERDGRKNEALHCDGIDSSGKLEGSSGGIEAGNWEWDKNECGCWR